jgi:hypothetical protein
MKLIYIMITYMFVGNHLRANHQSTLTTNRLLHRYLCLQPLPLFLLMWGGGGGGQGFCSTTHRLHGGLEGYRRWSGRYPFFLCCFEPMILCSDFAMFWICSLDYRAGGSEKSAVQGESCPISYQSGFGRGKGCSTSR